MKSYIIKGARRNFLIFLPSLLFYTMSTFGVVCNVQDFGTVGDGVANDAPAINKALSVQDRPLTVVIPKGTYLIGEMLKVHSDTVIEVEEGARLVMSGAWQKKEGDFLLCNADSVNGNEKISIRGGVWDGNSRVGYNVKSENLFEKGAWSGATVNFRNVKNLSLSNMEMANSVTFNFRMCELDGFVISNISFSATRKGWNQDGLHFNGFCRNGRISNIRAITKGQTNDDLLAFNADDAINRIENYGMIRGPIENIIVENVYAEDCHSAVRLLSVTSPIRNIRIKNIYAGCRCYAINADAARYCRTPLFKDVEHPNGVGRLSEISVDGFTFYATQAAKEPMFCIETNVETVKFTNLSRDISKDLAHTRPFIRIRKTEGMRITSDGQTVSLPKGGCTIKAETPKTFLLEKSL